MSGYQPNTDRERDVELQEAACLYATWDMWVTPCFSVKDGQCWCGDPDCTTPGAHLMFPGNRNYATNDYDTASRLWTENAGANISVHIGGKSGFCLLEVEPHGRDLWRAITEVADHDPSTVPQWTFPNGTRRYLYRTENEIPDSQSAMGPGINTIGSPQWTLMPPSQTIDGLNLRMLTEHLIQDAILELLPESLRVVLGVNTLRWQVNLGGSVGGKRFEGQARNRHLEEVLYRTQVMGFSVMEVHSAVRSANSLRCNPPLPDGVVAEIMRPPFISLIPQGKSVMTMLSEKATPPPWKVDRLIHEGLILMTGRPGLDKVDIALEVASSISLGRPAFGSLALTKGSGLALMQAESQERTTERIAPLTTEKEWKEWSFNGSIFTYPGLGFAWRWQPNDTFSVEKWAQANADGTNSLFLISSLESFIPEAFGRKKDEELLVSSLRDLERIAKENHMVVLVIHDHTDKRLLQEHQPHWMECANQVIIVEKATSVPSSRTLHVMSRFHSPQEHFLVKREGRWILTEPPPDGGSPERDRIIEYLRLKDDPKGIPPREIADGAGLPHSSVLHLVRELEGAGLLYRPKHGRYRVR